LRYLSSRSAVSLFIPTIFHLGLVLALSLTLSRSLLSSRRRNLGEKKQFLNIYGIVGALEIYLSVIFYYEATKLDTTNNGLSLEERNGAAR
jgi:hypothetical protein